MNIFFLSTKPDICAQMHCDKHVVKMILETAQILCAVHYRTESGFEPPYKKTHANHPCTVWASASMANYSWLVELGRELAKEYIFRYSAEKKPKSHKSSVVIEWAAASLPPLPKLGFTPPAQAMPDHYRVKDDPVAAYRAYYLGDKGHILTYRRRERPTWVVLLDDLEPSKASETKKEGNETKEADQGPFKKQRTI